MENCARLGFADTRGSESKEVGRRSGGCRGQGTGPSQSKTEDPVFRPGPRPHTKRAGTRSGTHLTPCNLPILSGRRASRTKSELLRIAGELLKRVHSYDCYED